MSSSSEEDIESDLDSEIYYIEDYVFENKDDDAKDEWCLSDQDENIVDDEVHEESDDSIELGIAPFMFEPTADPGNDASDENENDDDDDDEDDEDEEVEHLNSTSEETMQERVGNKNWCTCGECQAMEFHDESICCQEQESIPDQRYEGVHD